MARATTLFALALLTLLSVIYATPAKTVEKISTEIPGSERSEGIQQLKDLSEINHQTEISEFADESDISKSDRQFLPIFVTRGCQIRSGSHVVASCHSGELCRYTCRCRALRKDRFSIICGVRPPLYTGVVHRTRAVIKMRGGAVYSDSGRRCGC